MSDDNYKIQTLVQCIAVSGFLFMVFIMAHKMHFFSKECDFPSSK